MLLGWPLARLALVRFGPRALDSVRKICKEIREEKIFKIFSKNGESGLRGGQNPGIVIRVFGGNLENNIVNNESGCGAAW